MYSKKSILLMLLMALFMPWAARAQETHTVYDATDANQYIPMYGYYFDAYTKSECIIPATELTDMNGGTISAITFYAKTVATTNSTWGDANLTVFIKEVSNTTLGGSYSGTTDATVVFEGSLDMPTTSTDGYTITFSEGYVYNGGNLLIGVYNDTKGKYNKVEWYGKSGLTSGVSAYGNSSSSLGSCGYNPQTFLPKTTFTYTSGTVSCAKPKFLNAEDITAHSATLTWQPGAEGQSNWDVYVTTTATDVPDESTTPTYQVTECSKDLSTLTAQTTYYAYVRSVCGGNDGNSQWALKTFTTIREALIVDADNPYYQGFEESNDWSLTNKWCWGSATNNGGEKALYISNNDGTSNEYTLNSTTVVYASKLFNFDQGTYTIVFDWQANGEKTSWSECDYLRVALVPGDYEFTAGTSLPTGVGASAFPEGWIALDGGHQLNMQCSWERQVIETPVSGIYTLVFIWRNDSSSGNQPPAAIDNISISMTTCPRPSTPTVTEITARTAKLSWTDGGQEAWEIYLTQSATDLPDDDTQATHSANITNPFTLTGLTPDKEYYAYVRANCGIENGKSKWSEVCHFTTLVSCVAPTYLSIEGEVTSTSATLRWGVSEGQDLWEIYLTTDANDVPNDESQATYPNITTNPYTLTLNPQTTYYAYVRANCGAEDGKSRWTGMTVPITTPQIPVVIDADHPFADGFEGSDCGWALINGDRANKWWVGKATCNGGTQALYISNDEGVSNAYSSSNNATSKSMVYATKNFTFDGIYTFSFDWKCKGGYADYYRVALVPTHVVLKAGNSAFNYEFTYNGLPSGWIALDGGSRLNNTGESWENHTAHEVTLHGSYMMVFAWLNTSTYGGYNPPAAIDNVSINYITCPRPTIHTASNVEAHSAVIVWTENGTATGWTLQYSTDDGFSTIEGEINNGFTVSGNGVGCYLSEMDAETDYYVRVKSDCESDWSDAFHFTTLPTCMAPTGLSATKTGTTITLNWTAGAEGQDAWDIRYKKDSDTEYTFIELRDPSATSYTIEGLTPVTTYNVNVRAYCSKTDQSKWGYNTNQNNDLSVTTECGSLSLPYTYGFEENYNTTSPYTNSKPFPKCWGYFTYQSGYTGNYTYYPYVYTASWNQPYAHGGNGTNTNSGHCLYFYQTSSATNECAVLPEISGAYEMNNIQIRFWAAVQSSRGTLSIGVMNTPTSASSFTLIKDVEISNIYNSSSYDGFIEYTVSLEEYEGDGRYIAIKCGTSPTAYIMVDDITVEEIPSCRIPNDLEAEPTDSQATLTWTAGNNETAWNIQYKKASSEEWSELIVVNETTYTLPGLHRATVYDARVQAVCSDEDQSDWAEISFTTECGVWPIDADNRLFEDFENVGASDFPPICWSKFHHEMSGSTNSYWYLNSNNGLGSSAAFSYWNEGYGFLVMPKVHIDGVATLFFDYLIGSGTYNESCSVVVSTNEMTYADFNQTIWEAEGNYTPSVKSNATVSLADYDGQDIYVAFKFKGSGTSGCTWYVDNIEVFVSTTQTIELAQGWNWFVPIVEMSLTDLEEALDGKGLVIKTQNENVTYEDEEWMGDEIELTPGHMYKIEMSESCSFGITGKAAYDVNVTINPGNNWFGYTGAQEKSIEQIMTSCGFTPSEGDVIKTATGNTTFEDGEWIGDFDTLQPGEGYIYVSQDTETKQLSF